MTTTQAHVRQITAQELKTMLDSGTPLELWDVRTEEERATAKIEGAKLLDPPGLVYLDGLDRGTLLIFHCHHGIRSENAAKRFVSKGFTNVCNLVGGIDAWATQVDPKVPRY